MKKYRSSILFFAAACVILFVTVMVIQQQMQAKANRPIPTKKESIASPDVSVISVSPASYFSEVSAFGSADPHFSISLTSQVAGQIEQISADFENGKRVKKGITLAQLENSNYQAAVESARQVLSAAKVSLLEEERQGMQALAEWQSSGLKGEPDSDLVLRKPQLEAAKASVKNAQASLKSAEKDLARSMIKAPFDALIINRAVSLGSYIQTVSYTHL
ncbi:MAG TPA: biotin/lipoyl-binding protein, partial [Methylophaga aminisulfidivorans]|nr:biotin/lipoyl-binding protein [Methylophaga aminisulfidivorans]